MPRRIPAARVARKSAWAPGRLPERNPRPTGRGFLFNILAGIRIISNQTRKGGILIKVTVLNRAAAIRYCHQPHDADVVMISISTPLEDYETAPFVSETNGVKRILRLAFEDTDHGENVITKGDGARIAALVKAYSDMDFIVHCDAGQSRSAGVGAAIAKWLTGSDRDFFGNGKTPNMLCYRTVLNALYGE